MRIPFFAVVAVLGCSSNSGPGSGSGAVTLTLGPAAASDVYDTTPAGAGSITGSFSASGDYEGSYTLTTSIPMGSPLASCTLSVNGGSPSTSVRVTDSTGDSYKLEVQIGVGAAYAGQGICDVNASNDAKPGIGSSVTISVSGSS